MKSSKALGVAIICVATFILLTACNSTTKDPNHGPSSSTDIETGLYPHGRVSHDAFREFTDGVLTLSPDNVFKVDKPIIIEGENTKNLGGWSHEKGIGAYWMITIPEDGYYQAISTYSRQEEGMAGGWMETRYWDEQQHEWWPYLATVNEFDSTGSWDAYDVNLIDLGDIEGGTKLVFLLQSRPNGKETAASAHFINLQSIAIVKSEDMIDYLPDMVFPDIFSNNAISNIVYETDGTQKDAYWKFYQDATCFYEKDGERKQYTYVIEGSNLLLQKDGATVETLEIYNSFVLENSSGESYVVRCDDDTAFMEENFSSLSFFALLEGTKFSRCTFYEDGICEFSNIKLDSTVKGTYELDGRYMRVLVDDEKLIFRIIDKRMIVMNESEIYVMS